MQEYSANPTQSRVCSILYFLYIDTQHNPTSECKRITGNQYKADRQCRRVDNTMPRILKKYGRRKLPPELRRSVVLRVMVTEGDSADIEAIAEGWGVSLSTAAYAMIATELASSRSKALDLGSLGLTFASTIRLIAAQRLVREQPIPVEQMPEVDSSP